MPDQNQSLNGKTSENVSPAGRIETLLRSPIGISYLQEILIFTDNRQLLDELDKHVVRERIVASKQALEVVTWELGRRITNHSGITTEIMSLEEHFKSFNRILNENKRAAVENQQPEGQKMNDKARMLVNELDYNMSGYVGSFVGLHKTLQKYPVFPLPSGDDPELASKVSVVNEKYNRMVERFQTSRYGRGGLSISSSAKTIPNYLAVVKAGFILDAIDKNPDLEDTVASMLSIRVDDKQPNAKQFEEQIGYHLVNNLVRLPRQITPSERAGQVRKRVTEVLLHMLNGDYTLCRSWDIIRGLKQQSHEMQPGEFDRVVINALETGRIGFSSTTRQFLEKLYGPERKTIETGQTARVFNPIANMFGNGFPDFAPLHPWTLAENRKTVARIAWKNAEEALSVSSAIQNGEKYQKHLKQTGEKFVNQEERTKFMLKHYMFCAEPEVKAKYYPLLHPLLSRDDRQWIWFQESMRAGAKDGKVTGAEQKFRETLIDHMDDQEVITLGRKVLKERSAPGINGQYKDFTREDVICMVKRLARNLNDIPSDAEPPTRALIRELMEKGLPGLASFSPAVAPYWQPAAGPSIQWNWKAIENVLTSPQLPSRLLLPDPESEPRGNVSIALQYFPRTSFNPRVHEANVAEYLIRRAPMEDENFLKHLHNTLPWVDTEHLLSRLEKEEVQSTILASPRIAAIVGFELVSRRNLPENIAHDVITTARIENLAIRFNEILQSGCVGKSSTEQFQSSPELSAERQGRMEPGRMPYRGPEMR